MSAVSSDTGVNNPGLGRQFVGGLSWSAGAQLASQVVTFGAGVLLARLLSPTDFGVVGMAMVYTSFVWILGQTGFNAAIVYMKDVSDADLNTMYWANLTVNLLLLAAAVAISPLVGRFFQNPEVVPVVAVASIGLVASALGGVQRTLLEKRLEFKRLARNGFLASLSYAVVAVVMALAGFGVWALVVGRLVEQGIESLLAVFSVKWWPRFTFSRDSFMRLFGYGSRVWAGNMLFYGQENIDNLVVGRVLGATPLGYYSLAFRLANVPRWLFLGVVERVMFPSFSAGREQMGELRKTYLRIISYSVLVAVSLCAGMALVAREFVVVVYGVKWVPSVGPLRVLAIAGGLYCVSQATGPVLWAMGKPGLRVKLLSVSTLVLLIGAVTGSAWGVIGVAYGVLAAVLVGLGLGQYLVLRTLGIEPGSLLAEVAKPTGAIAFMALVVWAWRWLGLELLRLADPVWLVAAVVLGASALVGALVGMRAPHVTDVLSLIGRGGAVGSTLESSADD